MIVHCAHPAVRAKVHAYLRRVTDLPPAIRKRCCYCPIPHPIDGLGPIQPDELVSDGLCPEAFEIQMQALDRRAKERA